MRLDNQCALPATGNMDTLGFEPRAFRMRSGCDTAPPCALGALAKYRKLKAQTARGHDETQDAWVGGLAMVATSEAWALSAQRNPRALLGAVGGRTGVPSVFLRSSRDPRVGRLSSSQRDESVDTLGFEPRAFRMRSGCDTTTPCARLPTNRRALTTTPAPQR